MEDSTRTTSCSRRQPPTPPDGGWGWVVCVTVILCYGSSVAFILITPILHVALMKEFGEGDEDSSWVGVLALVTSLLFCYVAGVLSDRFGIRQTGFAGGVLMFVGTLGSAFVTRLELLYLTIGVFYGIGAAFACTPCRVILRHYFKKRLGLVNGLMTISSGLHGILYALVFPILLNALGLKKTLLCFSAINFLSMIYPLAWVPIYHRTEDLDLTPTTRNNTDNHTTDQDQESYDERQPILHDQGATKTGLFIVRIWKNHRFVILVIASAIAHMGYVVPTFHIVKYSEDLFPDKNADLLNMLHAAAKTISRALLSLVADLPIVRRHYMHIQQMCFFVLGFSTFCLSLATHYLHLVVVIILVGICDGMYFMLVCPLVLSMITITDASQGIGFYLTIVSVPHGLGVVVAAAMYDYYGNYNLAFQVLSIPLLVAALLMFLIDLL